MKTDQYPFSKLFRLEPTIHPKTNQPSYIIYEKAGNNPILKFEPGITKEFKGDNYHLETKDIDVKGDVIQGHVYEKSGNSKNHTAMVVKVDISLNKSSWEVSETWDDQFENDEPTGSYQDKNHTEFIGHCQPTKHPFD